MEKERRCLKCGKSFQSAWMGNRICQRCKGSNANSMAPTVPAAVRKSMKLRAREQFGDDSWRANPIIPELAPKQLRTKLD